MSSFIELDLPGTLNTSTANISQDFFVPLLARSIRYDRGVGFFSAGWLRLNAQGMANFARNSGRARWVTSPILSEDDWQALQLGETARYNHLLRRTLERNLDELERALEKETLSALAWLVADGILDFKLALPRNKLERGEFHDKFGVFTDADGNQVSFNGSYNDSIQGTRNYESIKVFCSWQPVFADLVQADAERFEKLWNNQDPNVQVFGLPEAAHVRIVRLRQPERPYPEPDRGQLRHLRETSASYAVQRPCIPANLTLRSYQIQAIEAWFASQCRGFFEMATGTGKTFAALAASVRLFAREGRLITVVTCPYTHLVSQWTEDVRQFGYKYIEAFGSAGPWQDKLANQLLNFSAGYIDNLVILTTHNTFSDPKFSRVIEQKPLPLLLIADEVHDLGAPKRRLGLRNCYRYRLGLSATPRRWLDEKGTEFLFSFFGGTVFEFSLADAIPEYLTPYDYYPFFVELYGDELQEYFGLTRKIVRRIHAVDSDDDEILERYLILRQKIVVNARAKYECFENILTNLKNISHTLVYCSSEQIDQVQGILNHHRVVQHRFTGQEPLKERERLLISFAQGIHKALVAMKCLDQGVDVPPTRHAVILASSGNPKQFIQRRGRILRRFPGKEKASIYDIIVVPTLSGDLDPATFEVERRILRRELRRYNEFAELALNNTYALNRIGPVKRRYLLREE